MGGPWDSSSSSAWLLGNRQTSDNPGEQTQLFTATQIWGHNQCWRVWEKQLPLSLNLFALPSLDRTGRLSRSPEAGWLPGRKNSKGAALKSTVHPRATSELTTGPGLHEVSCHGGERCGQEN